MIPKKIRFWDKSVKVRKSDALRLEILQNYKLTQLQIVKHKCVMCSLFRRNRGDVSLTLMSGRMAV